MTGQICACKEMQNMQTEWYHGSRRLFSRIEKRHPVTPDGNPKDEGFEAVYLTWDFGTALAFAAQPPGIGWIDCAKRTVRWEYPDSFDPEDEVYVYFVDLSQVPEEKVVRIDEWQVAVFDEIEPVKMEKHKAGEVLKFYTMLRDEP